MTRLLFWLPRAIALLFAAFLSLFAFGAATDGHGVTHRLAHFATSAVPMLVVLAALAVAWRWQRLGAALFLGLGVLYIAWAWGQFPLSTYVAISGPPILVAALFLLDWRYGGRGMPTRD